MVDIMKKKIIFIGLHSGGNGFQLAIAGTATDTQAKGHRDRRECSAYQG
ncbi:hypothetical protein HMPREF9138_02432 [Prevotella histicola F0411]|uniref:Uncharacterized protein n=1 Tax=Prevotella histicola F0411 TaxID=857291 RepID=G6AK05_9BACT|nr:hypothetical protein HMPREF9138_02432 [Prevotella histicola F0411]